MILKSKDSRQEEIKELHRLLGFNLSAKQRFFVKRELKCLQSGESNELNSAYYLDFRYKDSPNWAVIHDLRIEHRGRVAQIDHLLINRFLDVYVLESKNYYYGIKITPEGEFLVWNGKGYEAIESPIEQNARHVQALQMVVEDRNLAPRRLGFAIPISYRNRVLLSPTSKILRPETAPFDLSCIVKADAFVSYIEREMDKKSFVEAPKLIGSDTLRDFAEKLVRLHRPGSFDYIAKFRVVDQGPAAVRPEVSVQPALKEDGSKGCQKCGVEVDKKVVYYCNINKARFGGQILCRECQASFSGASVRVSARRP